MRGAGMSATGGYPLPTKIGLRRSYGRATPDTPPRETAAAGAARRVRPHARQDGGLMKPEPTKPLDLVAVIDYALRGVPRALDAAFVAALGVPTV